MRKLMLLFLTTILFFSCEKKQKNSVDVSNVEVDFKIDRFEVDFYNTTKETLEKTKIEYPSFFPKNVPDSIWIQKISNADERELYNETLKKYTSLETLEADLTLLFKHVKYYDANFYAPNLTTVISNIDYNYRVIYNKESLIISLDCYLGVNHPFYNDYPNYIKETNTDKHIIVDVANEIISSQFLPDNDRSFLGKIIEEGKKMYLLDLYLPLVPNHIKIGYSAEKFKWATSNEEQVWKYFLDRNILYNTDTKLNKQFIDNAPFSKFYLSQDNLSPGRIGVYLGWQIVRSYMYYNDVNLQELLKTKPQDLFLKSKYKPKR
ncbi:MAG: gliding motility lipoprotein GldB [Flavobacteriaceae bacterium]